MSTTCSDLVQQAKAAALQDRYKDALQLLAAAGDVVGKDWHLQSLIQQRRELYLERMAESTDPQQRDEEMLIREGQRLYGDALRESSRNPFGAATYCRKAMKLVPEDHPTYAAAAGRLEHCEQEYARQQAAKDQAREDLRRGVR